MHAQNRKHHCRRVQVDEALNDDGFLTNMKRLLTLNKATLVLELYDFDTNARKQLKRIANSICGLIKNLFYSA